ncbi:MAG: S1/P1 nuclease, partial [Hyphomonadaceae bacterium]
WHYDNIPFCGRPVYEDYCADGNCATAAIARAERTLANARASSRDRQRALARLVHLIGDIHQPLHAITNNDRGGNSGRVTLVGEWNGASDADNLHALWDSALVDYAIAAEPGATQILARAHARDWSTGDARAWVLHAHDIAVSTAYGALPGGTQCNQPQAGPVAIDRRYAAAAAPIVRAQLTEASIRLAATLNRLFQTR